MPRTLLIADPAVSWREWLKSNLGSRDFICLDPGDPVQSPPGRFTLYRGDKAAAWCFFGGLDPLRAPHVALACLSKLLGAANEDGVVQLPPYRPGPLMRQFMLLAAELVRPSEILISQTLSSEFRGLPVGPQSIELEPGFPDLVRHAQRKALWIKLIEEGEEHEIELSSTAIEGARLGSGHRVESKSLDALHVEACGSTLLVVSEKHPEDGDLARALDSTHCSRAHIVAPDAYRGLLCAFSRQDGEDFGMGVIRQIDFAAGLISARCSAVAPAPVRILRLGGLQLDMEGNEIEEVRPWQV